MPTFVLALLLAPAADPLGDTLALIPPDPAIVFVVRDARRHSQTLTASPFAKWLREQSGGVTESRQFAVLSAGATFLSSVLGVTPREFLDDIIGDAVVLTYTPASGKTPEIGAVYLKPRNPATFRRIVAKLNELQTASGEVIKVESIALAEQRYSARRKPGGQADFLAERDGVFVFTPHEPTARDFLTCRPGSTIAERIHSAGAGDAMMIALFQPRVFDAELESRRKLAADPGEAAFLTQFNRVWASLDALAISITPQNKLDFTIAATYRAEALPEELRDLKPTRERATETQLVGAMMTANLPLSVPKWIRLGKSFLAADARQQFDAWLLDGVGPAVGRDNLPKLLATLGPNASFAAFPPPDGAWVPAWRIGVDITDATGEAQSAARDGLSVLGQFLRYDYNSKHKDQLVIRADDGIVTASAAGLPAGVAPSYVIGSDSIVVASRPGLAVPAKRQVAGTQPLMRVDAAALRGYLRAHREPLASWLATTNDKPAEESRRELDAVIAALDALRGLEMHSESRPGVARLTLSVEFAEPLKGQ